MYEWCRILKEKLLLTKVLDTPSAFSGDTTSIISNSAASEGFSENYGKFTVLKQRPKHNSLVAHVLNSSKAIISRVVEP